MLHTYFILESNCMTIGGNFPNKPCIFPFKFDGSTYYNCKHEDDSPSWCSTKVDENGNHVKGNWGDCGPFCPKGMIMQGKYYSSFKFGTLFYE